MTYTDNFRTAMRGFNRTDVVQFIQRLTAEHEKELRALREENERLTNALDAAQTDLQAAVDEKAVLEDQLLALRELPEEAETAAAPDALDAPIAPAEALSTPTGANLTELELAAYRRAEMAERLARERAAAADEQMKALFAQSREKLTLATGDFATMLAAFQADFDQLRQVIQSAQGVLNESGDGLTAVENMFDAP